MQNLIHLGQRQEMDWMRTGNSYILLGSEHFLPWTVGGDVYLCNSLIPRGNSHAACKLYSRCNTPGPMEKVTI